jgi:Fe-S-cluster containining protein
VVTDLVEIRRLAESKRVEYLDFRRYLRARHHPFEPFQALANEMQKHINCTTCANCCRHTIVSVGRAEIDAIASHLGIEAADVIRQYTSPDPGVPAAIVLLNRNDACAFLDGNLCMIYAARPAACRNFPHLAPGAPSLGGRMSSLCRNAWFCPVIFNALESYKHLVGYHPARDCM